MSEAFGVERTIVSTDDPEIAHVCEGRATVHMRPAELAVDQTTLDQVAMVVGRWLIEEKGADGEDLLFTIQPTSPFLRPATVMDGVRKLSNGASSVISVKDDRHLRWTTDEAGSPRPLFDERVNRQWLSPTWAETGGLIGAKIGDLLGAGTRIVEPIELIAVDAEQGLDIDSYTDWAVAEFLTRRQRIVIRADASPQRGMGHVYRALALAHEFADHDLLLVTRSDGANGLGAEFLSGHPYPIRTVETEDIFFELLTELAPALTVIDLLDTDRAFMKRVKPLGGFMVSMEDLGPGSLLADLVINDLYTDAYPQDNHWYGVANAILAPQFETTPPIDEIRKKVGRVLVTYGGTDPCDLTSKALEALSQLKFGGHVDVVIGPGNPRSGFGLAELGLSGELHASVTHMAALVRRADLAITSAGRTVTETMSLGVPTLVLCQNLRELSHTHASSPFGVMNLGLGQHVEVSSLADHLRLLIEDQKLRRSMHHRALAAVRDRSNHKIAQRILSAARGEAVVNGRG